MNRTSAKVTPKQRPEPESISTDQLSSQQQRKHSKESEIATLHANFGNAAVAALETPSSLLPVNDSSLLDSQSAYGNRTIALAVQRGEFDASVTRNLPQTESKNAESESRYPVMTAKEADSILGELVKSAETKAVAEFDTEPSIEDLAPEAAIAEFEAEPQDAEIAVEEPLTEVSYVSASPTADAFTTEAEVDAEDSEFEEIEFEGIEVVAEEEEAVSEFQPGEDTAELAQEKSTKTPSPALNGVADEAESIPILVEEAAEAKAKAKSAPEETMLAAGIAGKEAIKTSLEEPESDVKKMVAVKKVPAKHSRGVAKKTDEGGARTARKGGLGDAALDAWKSVSGAAVDTNPDTELPTGEQAVTPVNETAAAIAEKRQENDPDFSAELKSNREPIPKQPEKDSQLDTSEAEAAVKKVQGLSSKTLTSKSFSSIGLPPPYEGLNPRDFVPATHLETLKDLESKLAKTDLSKTERADLTKKLTAVKERIAAIEEAGSKGTPSSLAPTVTDKGPSLLESSPPAQCDVMGDAIARAMGAIEGRGQKIATAASRPLDGGKMPELNTLATDKAKPVESEMRDELKGIASAAGVTGKELEAKIAKQKKDAEDNQAANNDAVKTASTDGAEKISADGTGELVSIAGAKANADKEIKAAQEAVKGPPDTEAIEKKRDEMLNKVKSAGGEVLAAYRSSLTKFNTKIDDAGTQQKRDIRTVSSSQRAAIRRHWSEDPDKGAVEGLPTRNWGTKRSRQVNTESARFKRDAKVEHDAFGTKLNDELSTARNSVRDWAARQDGRERSWWEKLWDSIVDWGTQAVANNEAWEKQRNADSRDAMAGDLDTLSELREAQLKGNFKELNEQLARLEADQRALAIAYLKGNGVDSIGFVAESTMLRIVRRRTSEMTKALQEEVLASWNWELLGRLARTKNPGFQPKVIANKVKGSIAGWGTKEDKLFAALGTAKGPFERAAVEKCYQATFGVSMANDVDDDVDGTEWRRAEALMKGDNVAIAVTTIKDAVDGAGTDEKAIKDALRGKTPYELEEIKRLYLETYGKELSVDLSDDLSGKELDNALALADGDMETADAADLADAMSGPGTDEEKIQAVYDKIRREVEAEAKANGMSAAEMRAQIKLRNKAVTNAYAKKYGRSLTKDFKEDLGGSDLTLAHALRSGDATAIDAAKAKVEKDSLIYASDDRLEDIVRNQRKQAETEVDLDMGAEKARLREQVRSGDLDLSPKELKEKLAELEKRHKKDREQQVAALSKSNMDALKSKYGDITGKGAMAFGQMIDENTMGYSNAEISALIREGGKLSDEDEIYYAVAGAGTDEDKIKEILKDKTPDQIKKIRKKYENKYGKGSFNKDILSDLSGREDLDTELILDMGDPSTFPQQLADKKNPEERKKLLEKMEKYLVKRKQFEETGSMGRMLSGPNDQMNTAKQMQDALEAAKRYDEALAHPDSDKAKAAKEVFDMQFSGAVEAQEQHREQIDSYAEIVVQIGAAAAGIAVTVATFGTAGPVVAAMYGAAASAAAGMALKADLRGAAYSWEEAGVDAVVGVVDVLAAGAGARYLGPALGKLDDVVLGVAAKMGVEKAVAKKIVQEAVKEAVQNGLEAFPSAIFEAGLDDKIWASDDPFGNFMTAGSTAAAMSAGIAVGVSGLKGIAGAVIGSKTDVDVETDVGAHVEPPPAELSPHDIPDSKSIDLPPEVDPEVAALKEVDDALKSDLPPKSSSLPDGSPKSDLPLPVETPGGARVDETGARGSTDTEGHLDADGVLDLDLPENRHLTEGMVGGLSGDDAFDPKAAHDFYNGFVDHNVDLESALLRNTATGEYLVVQGGPDSVDFDKMAGGWENLIPPDLRGKGRWALESHSHPADPTTNITSVPNRYPSGGSADFGGVVIEAEMRGGAATQEIQVQTEQGRKVSRFGYDPDHAQPYFVDVPAADGSRHQQRFATIDDYHDWYGKTFGHELPPVSPDFSGARRTDSGSAVDSTAEDGGPKKKEAGASKEPVSEKPATEDPVPEPPATEAPIPEKPATKEPVPAEGPEETPEAKRVRNRLEGVKKQKAEAETRLKEIEEEIREAKREINRLRDKVRNSTGDARTDAVAELRTAIDELGELNGEYKAWHNDKVKLAAREQTFVDALKAETYARPSGWREGMKEQAWENAKGSDGVVCDPVTREPMKFDEPWVMGHKPKLEFRKHQLSAAKRGISRQKFLDEYYNIENYRPETPETSSSHAGEDNTDAYEGP